MIILTKKGQEMHIKPESIDDLWVLSTVISESDSVKGTTLRKVSIGDKSTEKVKVSKKPLFLEISVEKVEFTEHALRILGSITNGPEDIPRGEHHTFALEPNQEITITKDWHKYQLDQINDAVNKKETKILACLFNREEALFGKLEQNSFKVIGQLKGSVAKKQFDQVESNFFSEILSELTQKIESYSPEVLLFGSPSFWKSAIQREFEHSHISQKAIFTTVSEVTPAGFTELLQQKEVELALTNVQASKNQQLIDLFFAKLSKNEPVCYGITDSLHAASSGAIEELLCTGQLIAETRENGTFSEIEGLFSAVEKSQGKIRILTGKNDAVIRLNGLGGVAGILRYAIK